MSLLGKNKRVKEEVLSSQDWDCLVPKSELTVTVRIWGRVAF